MNDLQTELTEKVYPLLLTHILFFDTWSDPKDFFTMSRKERLALMRKMKPMSVAPTQSNFWIWFGSYGGSNHSPRYDNNSVSKHLFETLISPCNGKRIMSTFITTRAEVNPFKFSKAVGMTLVQKRSMYQQMTGKRPPSEIDKTTDQLEAIKACKEELDLLFFPDVCDTKEIMQKALTKNGFSDFAIAEAFKLSLDKDWKTTA